MSDFSSDRQRQRTGAELRINSELKIHRFNLLVQVSEHVYLVVL